MKTISCPSSQRSATENKILSTQDERVQRNRAQREWTFSAVLCETGHLEESLLSANLKVYDRSPRQFHLQDSHLQKPDLRAQVRIREHASTFAQDLLKILKKQEVIRREKNLVNDVSSRLLSIIQWLTRMKVKSVYFCLLLRVVFCPWRGAQTFLGCLQIRRVPFIDWNHSKL